MSSLFYCILDLYNVDDTFLSIIVLNGFDTGIMRNHALSVFQQQAILLNQGVTFTRQLGNYMRWEGTLRSTRRNSFWTASVSF